MRNVFLKFYNQKCRETVLASNSGGTQSGNTGTGTQFVTSNFMITLLWTVQFTFVHGRGFTGLH